MTETLRFRCPGCGSELEAPEGAISNRCSFCGLVSLLGRPGRIVKRYYPPRIDTREARFIADRHLKQEGRRLFSRVDRRQLYYIPFYRFRGLSLSCLCSHRPAPLLPGWEVERDTRTYELRARNIDLTIVACSDNPFGLTGLGVRPQAVTAYAYRDDELPEEALVLPADLPPRESQERAIRMDTANLSIAHGAKQLEFSEMVGEHQALLYFPIYVCTGRAGEAKFSLVIDGLSRRVIHEVAGDWHEPVPGPPALGITDLRPEPHRCPNCAADFEPSEQSLAYVCTNCDRNYLLEPGGFRLISQPLVGGGPGTLYPFWRIPMVFTGGQRFDTVGSFTRVLTADIPLLDKRKRDLPFFVYVPAFSGADAEWHVRTAVRLTRTQPWVVPGKPAGMDPPPVSLPESEGLEFAAFAWNWLRVGYLNLRSDHFAYAAAEKGRATLIWLPLVDLRLERSVTHARGHLRTASSP
jgi:DNA-directed RNA polymerase subunit RPC12/RpoP